MIVAIFIVVAALAAALVPGSALELQRGGAMWRVVTCHFTHFTFEQLAWDAVVLLVIGIASARRGRQAFHATLLASIVIVPIAVLLFAPNVQTYRGLSGIDSALFALLLTLEVRRGAPVALFAIAFAAKIAFEMFTSTAVFAGGGFAPVPVAHLAGAAVGLVVGMCTLHACERSASRPHKFILRREAPKDLRCGGHRSAFSCDGSPRHRRSFASLRIDSERENDRHRGRTNLS